MRTMQEQRCLHGPVPPHLLVLREPIHNPRVLEVERPRSFPFDAEGELAAALRSDKICRENGRPVHNFPRDGDLGVEPPISRYYGVTKITWNADVRWRARIPKKKNEIYIGSFDEEQEAARAVDEYLASIGYERRNFPEDEVEDLEDLGGDAVSSPQ